MVKYYGYMGLEKPKNFFLNGKSDYPPGSDPWIVNCFAGITKLTMSMPQIVANNINYKQSDPRISSSFTGPSKRSASAILSISTSDTRVTAWQAAQHIAASDLFAKIWSSLLIKTSMSATRHRCTRPSALAGNRTRFSLLIPQTRGFPLDPSAPTRWMTSKMIIDATRQWPQEGGPEKMARRFPGEIIEDSASPEAFELVAAALGRPISVRDWRLLISAGPGPSPGNQINQPADTR